MAKSWGFKIEDRVGIDTNQLLFLKNKIISNSLHRVSALTCKNDEDIKQNGYSFSYTRQFLILGSKYLASIPEKGLDKDWLPV